jgi:competence protein ComEC
LFIFNLLFFMKRKFNSIRIIITVLLLWSFAFVTGLTPSVLRATLMFSFLQAGKLMKRNVNSINSVLASAVILLIIHPSVLFDAGFLLSYSAVIFIICFYEDFYLKLSFKTWITDKIWQSAAITIVAQAGTLPLTITLFNRFPTWFILTNIIIVPLSSFLIIIGCLVPLTFPVRFISQPLASVLSYLTGLTETLTEKAAALPFSTIENIGMVTIESMLLFLFIFLFILFILNRRTFPLRYPLYAFLLFTSAGTIRSIADRASGELIVYNTPGSEAIGLRTGKILNLYCDNTIIPPEVLRHCAARGLKLNPNIINKKYNYIISGKSKILISSFLSDMLIRKTEPDHIIITSPNPLIKKQLHFSRPINSIVITPSVFSYFNISEKLKNANIDTIHYVKKSGAFRMRL